jgi:hypothetical protein
MWGRPFPGGERFDGARLAHVFRKCLPWLGSVRAPWGFPPEWGGEARGVTACEAGGERREPTTTVQGELGESAEEAPVQVDEDETDGEGGGSGPRGTHARCVFPHPWHT